MSLILEALRKSEAERQRARLPELLSPVPGRRRRRRRWPGMLLGLLLAVALGAAGSWWLLGQRRSEVVEPAVPVTPDASAQHAPAEPITETAPPAAVPAEAAPTLPVPVPRQPPAPAPARPATAPSDPEFDSVERESLPQAPAVLPPPQVPLPVHQAPVPAAPRADPASQPGGPPRLNELPAEARAGLPPLKLSVHVYSEQPEQRFVVIDGRRHGEGAPVANELWVVEIRRDGTVLEFRGTRFLLPRPG